MRVLIVSLCIGLISTGCATSSSTKPGGGNMDPMANISLVPVKPVSCMYPIVIELDASANATFKMPDEIYVCTKRQDVYWYAKGATAFRISFRPDKTTSNKKAKLKKYDADCSPDKVGSKTVGYLCMLKWSNHDEGGDIAYEFHAQAENGEAIDKDPRLIIQP